MRLTRDNIDRVLGIVALVVVAAFVVYSVKIGDDEASSRAADAPYRNIGVAMFQSSSCDCCDDYKAYLLEQGFTVMTTYTNDMAAVKQQFQIPELMVSCHTVYIAGYFVEGHVPVAAIEKLLEEKPAIDGIALPGMPQGSPGMPGEQLEPLVIYAVTDGKISEFMVIEKD